MSFANFNKWDRWGRSLSGERGTLETMMLIDGMIKLRPAAMFVPIFFVWIKVRVHARYADLRNVLVVNLVRVPVLQLGRARIVGIPVLLVAAFARGIDFVGDVEECIRVLLVDRLQGLLGGIE